MRIRATVAAVSGALVLSALAVPASQAAQSDDHGLTVGGFEFLRHGDGASPRAQARALSAQAAGLPVITKVVVNGGKPIVIGTTTVKKIAMSATATDDLGVLDVSALIWEGSSLSSPTSRYFEPNDDLVCKVASATTSTCTHTTTIDAGWLVNTDAKTWNVAAGAYGNGGEDDLTVVEKFNTVKLQRQSKLTVNAAPEPVKKGGTITITGSLTRADWDKNKYVGFGTQSVVLQFRKKSSTAYTNVKGVKSSSTGALKTTVKATEDGYYRWNYVGIASTAPVAVAGDFIDVK
ncbi:DUF5707 domain-containing protein [Streptomyces lushanensis]|uniref:DUF5707 domain-containing protein n=1 Tax=Streptomyces lushanensis TaxID=1434255 RepID=UPI000831F6A9|nr:DUF5707 domain-containing protein [Streptomyces lushanensis]